MITKIKACKFCGETTHYPFQCRLNPKPGKAITKNTPSTKRWIVTRRAWFRVNHQEYFNCHYCGKLLAKNEVELDHFLSRSRRPDLKYDLTNLVPCCRVCNNTKGSLNGDEFKQSLVNKMNRHDA